MPKHQRRRLFFRSPGLIVAIIIALGVALGNVVLFGAYSRIIDDSTRSISELAAMNIYSELSNELTKPIYVSLTMANDTFVVDWLKHEDTAEPADIVGYLDGIQAKYGYSSVFLVSSGSEAYYRHTGFHKFVSPDDDHDVWYYGLMARDVLYELDVDVDEANGTLTIFVNAKLFDGETCLGVIGVGVEMDAVQAMIGRFETDYGLEAFLVDDDGLVQSHSVTTMIEHRNIFEEDRYAAIEPAVRAAGEAMAVHETDDGYVITRHLDELGWYVIVLKTADIVTGYVRDFLFLILGMTVVVLVFVDLVVGSTVKRHREQVSQLAATDYLTGLLNRRGFETEFARLRKENVAPVVFMADIDRFKRHNDRYGHDRGDAILKTVAGILGSCVGSRGVIARWGGDEFVGAVTLSEAEVAVKLEECRKTIAADPDLQPYEITLSVGYTFVVPGESADEPIKRADDAMLLAKQRGGDASVPHPRG